MVKDTLTDFSIGKMVMLFAMDCMADIHEEICLGIQYPRAFQELCWLSCKDAPNAYFDNGDIYGWMRPTAQVSNRFVQEFLPQVHQDDIDNLKFWFRNGHGGLQQHGPVKNTWLRSFRWAWKLQEPIADLTHDELHLIKEFWEPIKKAIYADEYDDLKDEIAKNSTSERDEAIKVKFHLNPLGDHDFVFQDLDFMREGHLLIKHWRMIKQDSALYTALQKLPYAWWDENPERRKYLKFDIREERAFMVSALIQ